MGGKWPLVLLGGVAYIVGTAATYTWIKNKKDEEQFAGKPLPKTTEQTVAVYDSIADKYDKTVGQEEQFMGINRWRKQLLAKAKGTVLELAAGTTQLSTEFLSHLRRYCTVGSGRNWEYYPPNVQHVIAVDASPKMLEKAEAKKLKPQQLTFHLMDAHNLTIPSNSVDTVVETFALCSYANPNKVLEEMKRVCKEDGQILLLEHGRSNWKLLSYLMDKYAEMHAKKWGCWWNRDIDALLATSGLDIIEHRRKHLGTLHWVVARPRKQEPAKDNTSVE